jgi:hypothetical protein
MTLEWPMLPRMRAGGARGAQQACDQQKTKAA